MKEHTLSFVQWAQEHTIPYGDGHFLIVDLVDSDGADPRTIEQVYDYWNWYVYNPLLAEFTKFVEENYSIDDTGTYISNEQTGSRFPHQYSISEIYELWKEDNKAEQHG